MTPPRSYTSHHWMGRGNRGYSIHTRNIPLNMSFSMRNNKNRIIPITLSSSLSVRRSNYHLCVFISCLYSPETGGKFVFGGVCFMLLGVAGGWGLPVKDSRVPLKGPKTVNPVLLAPPKTNAKYSLAQICNHYPSFSVPLSFTLS